MHSYDLSQMNIYIYWAIFFRKRNLLNFNFVNNKKNPLLNA